MCVTFVDVHNDPRCMEHLLVRFGIFQPINIYAERDVSFNSLHCKRPFLKSHLGQFSLSARCEGFVSECTASTLCNVFCFF